MLPWLADALAEELHALEKRDRLRVCPDGSGLIGFCSNDYLGLAGHPALAEAARGLPLGAGSSRLVSGDRPEHRALESALAAFLGTQSALLFPTGYQANLGTIGALVGREDLIVSDAANHASLIDGCRLSRAEVVIYPHADADAAGAALAQAGRKHRRRLLVTESLFSMDGDSAPLPALAALAREHQAVLVVDEAHAVGVLGPEGRGLCRAAGIEPDVLIGTLGKAFGCFGGFVAGPTLLRSLLVNRARTFIFTTAPPPGLAATAHAALRLIAGDEGTRRRAALAARIDQLCSSLGLPRAPGPILPIRMGADRAAVEASASLRAQGLFVQAIRPPTVPEGTARLRVTLSAAHQPAEVDRLAAALRPFLP